MGDTEERICVQCDVILSDERQKLTPGENSDSPTEQTEASNGRQPNPNNPMEYCSVIPPHQQVLTASQTPISVMVPVGVLKREGAPRSGRKDKNVIFSDGIRPGCDLTDLDNNWGDNNKPNSSLVSSRKSLTRRAQTPPGKCENDMCFKEVKNNTMRSSLGNTSNQPFKSNIQLPLVDETNNSYIPKKDNELPPIYTQTKTDFKYTDLQNGPELLERLKTETLKFAIQRNFYVYVKIIQCE
jgi:MAD, mothers against decapentaplegic interacting protein